MPGIPDNVLSEIVEKRTPSSEAPVVEEKPKDEEAKAPESKVETPKTEDKPEPKKGEKAPTPKNGQSIAQVAEAADEDDEDEDDDADPKDGTKKKNRNRDSMLRELIDQKKENKVISKQYGEMAKAMDELIKVVTDLKGNKSDQKDEIEEFAEEWGLNPDGAKALMLMLEKKLSTKFGSAKRESDDEDDAKKPEKQKPEPENTALKLRKIELAIESEYEDYLDSYPQAKGKINMKAIKSFILSDEENLSKSFSKVVEEMYPGLLANKAGVDGGSDAGTSHDNDEKPDWNDPKVIARLESDPKLKAQYQDSVIERAKASARR